jgi:putative two-component system response regulator
MNTHASSERPVVLVVDDTPQNLVLITELLRQDYRMLVANGGERAIKLAEGELRPDLILLDIMMPDMDGYEVLRRLKASPLCAQIPVIFLSAKSEIDDEIKGLQLGAVDYITKPISPPLVQARVKTHLALKASSDFLRDKSAFLEAEVGRRTQQIGSIQDVAVLALSSMAETRDNETGNHILRTQRYVKSLAMQLREHPRFREVLSAEYIDRLFKSAPLHDIGKVGIPDPILLKPAPLSPAEFEVMKTHTTIGYESLVRAEKSLGIEFDFLNLAKEIALSHQEKWDGSGYPKGLVGDAIPVSARLMAVADVYDALISKRVYKEAMSHEQALEIMRRGRGKHFDPDMLDAFFQIEGEFRTIAQAYNDD